MTPVLTHTSPAFRDNLPSPSQKILPSPSLMHPQPRSPSPASPQPTLSPVLFSVFQLSQLMHQGFQFCLSGWLGTSQVTSPEGSPAPPQRTRPEQHSLLASLALGPDARVRPHPMRSCSSSSIFSARAITLLMISFSSSVSSSCFLPLSA